MIAVLQRHRLVLIAVSLTIAALIAWLFIAKQNSEKIPSRGVFIMRQVMR